MKYFKGLDTLRALASLIVVWGHIELLKMNNSIPNLIDNNFFVFPSGHIAVVLFFSLSGFLITYLLVKEKEREGKISLKKFYLRRILRIWPLYYFIIILSYFLIDSTSISIKTIILSLTIFPNVAHAIGEGWTISPQIWSIGVEEQFYLFWPIIIILIPSRKILPFLIIFIIIFSIFPHLFGYLNLRTFNKPEINNIIYELFNGTKFNCMAMGSLVGYSLATNKKWISYFSFKPVAVSLISIAIFFWFFKIELNYFNDEFYGVLFSLMILGIVNNEGIKIDSKTSSFLGRISYGIYMYHWIILLFAMKYITYRNNDLVYNIQIYFIVFSITILISWLSFETFEKYFLNIKKKFEIN